MNSWCRSSPLLLLVLAGSAIGAEAAAAGGNSAERPTVNPLAAHVRVGADGADLDAPVSLTPEAAEALRRKVLVHCGMANADTTARLPWYFHFEYGHALLGAGDAARAVRQISEAASLNPTSQADKRMYGMWYADYFPYADLALAHAQLGNWPCATDALRLAESQNEDGPRAGNEAYVALKKTIRAHAADATSCLKQDVMDPAYETSR